MALWLMILQLSPSSSQASSVSCATGFRCPGVADLRLELRDAILYAQDDSSRLLVETSRIALVSSECPSIKAFILDLATSNTEAHRVCMKACAGLPSAVAGSVLGHHLSDLEHLLCSHLALLQPAAALPGATAAGVVSSLLDSLSVIRRGGPLAGGGGGGSHASGVLPSNAGAASAGVASQRTTE